MSKDLKIRDCSNIFGEGGLFSPGWRMETEKKQKEIPKSRGKANSRGRGRRGGMQQKDTVRQLLKKKCALVWAEKVCPKLHLFVSCGNPSCVSFHRSTWVGATGGSKKFSLGGAVFPVIGGGTKPSDPGGEWGNINIKFLAAPANFCLFIIRDRTQKNCRQNWVWGRNSGKYIFCMGGSVRIRPHSPLGHL